MAIIRVAVVDEKGSEIQAIWRGIHVLARVLPDSAHPKLPLLSHIDKFGDTTFNRLQVEALLVEMDLLYAQDLTPEERRIIQSIQRLASDCLVEPHRYLKFLGD